MDSSSNSKNIMTAQCKKMLNLQQENSSSNNVKDSVLIIPPGYKEMYHIGISLPSVCTSEPTRRCLYPAAKPTRHEASSYRIMRMSSEFILCEHNKKRERARLVI